MDNLLKAIDELSRTTDQIEKLNPNALEAMADALTARSRIMIRIHQTVVDGQVEASPALLDRLAKELKRGTELIRRLTLVQARLRSEYQQCRRHRDVLGGIHASSSTRVNALDIQG